MQKILMLVVLVLAAMAFSPVYGVSSGELDFQMAPMAARMPLENDNQTVIDANRLMMFVTNTGLFAYDQGAFLGRSDGLYFPRGTNLTVLYSSGLWLGGKIEDELRISVAEYNAAFVPGPMAGGTFLPDDPSFKVYKIYQELRENGFYDDPRPVGDPESEEMWDDYHNWPVGMGAPVGVDDKPQILGDQTLWCVYNDADPSVHTNEVCTDDGLGIEIQLTVFAYDVPGPLGNCIFMRYHLINKSGNPIGEAYASFWADPDVGAAGDDYTGCDSILGIGYAYNATNGDDNYGVAVPAVGFCLLQGPEVPTLINSADDWHASSRNLPMTAYTRFLIGTDPDSPQEGYWYMKGLDAKNSGNPFIDPVNSMVTTYVNNGDPVTDIGWVDCCTYLKLYIDADIEVFEIAGPGGVPLDPPWDVACVWNSTSEFYITSDIECDLSRMNVTRSIGDDSWEFRFTNGGSEYYEWLSAEKYGHRAPFEVWNIGPDTPDDPSDDMRIQFGIIDDDWSGGFSAGDRVYPFELEYSEPLPQISEVSYIDDCRIGRIKFAGSEPQEGTVVRFSAVDPDTSYDPLSTDCRYLVSSGPFEMADAETQEVWVAVVVGQGVDRLSSVTEMKNVAAAAREAFAAGFAVCDCAFHGDCDADGAINAVDILYVINYALRGGEPPAADDYCPAINRGDYNCDNRVDMLDIVKMVNYVFRFPAPGPCDPCAE